MTIKQNQMTARVNIKYGLVLISILSTVVTISCADGSRGKENTSVPQVEAAMPSTTQGATTTAIRLKFTTGVRSILEDSKGNIWFGSYQEGVGVLHNGQLHYFTTENGLSDNQVRSIYEDKNGIIWFECGRGLSKYDGIEMTTPQERDYQSKNEWKSTKDDLWFKGNESVGFNKLERYPGVYQYDGKKLSYRAFPIKAEDDYLAKMAFGYSTSTPFVKGKDGTIWFGTYNALIGYKGSRFTIIDNGYLGLTKESRGLHIRSILADSKGNIWIGNNGLGVLKYDGKKVINFTQQQNVTAGPLMQTFLETSSLTKVFAIGEDNGGAIWFGTVGSGVWKYDGKNVINYTKLDGLVSSHIWTIYKSKKGEMWFGGANPSGVYKFNGNSFDRIY
jgi:ligand-binding sensor domain-containing protein